MSTYTLRIQTKTRPATFKEKGEDRVLEFDVPAVNGQLQFPANALRVIFGKHPDYQKSSSVEWVGERPDVFACGALTQAEADKLTDNFTAEADLAMQIMNGCEPERMPTMEEFMRLYGPPAEAKIIGEVVDGEERYDGQ